MAVRNLEDLEVLVEYEWPPNCGVDSPDEKDVRGKVKKGVIGFGFGFGFGDENIWSKDGGFWQTKDVGRWAMRLIWGETGRR